MKTQELEKSYNGKLSEFVGIILGDGSLALKNVNSKYQNRLQISLNSIDDKEYSLYIVNLINDLFNVEPLTKKRKNENTLDIHVFRKKIILFLVDKVGLRLSPKWNTAIIPPEFLVTPFDLYVLRGYFDTDGSLVMANNNGILYPRLEMKICPSPMQQQFVSILEKYNFRFGAYQIGKGKIRVQMNGKEELKKWVKLVGFSNPKHARKSRNFL